MNIVLDVVFILVFHLDVFGAALATVLSQVLAGAGCLLRMRRGFPQGAEDGGGEVVEEDGRKAGEDGDDVAVGPRRPMGLLLGFGIPVLLGYLFQQLYSVIDTAINSLLPNRARCGMICAEACSLKGVGSKFNGACRRLN